MCYFCDNIVSVQEVLSRMAAVIRWFSGAMIAPTVNLAVALRMIARLSQSREYNDAVDMGDQVGLRRLETVFVSEAISFAKMYGLESDREKAIGIFRELTGLFSAENVPVDNVLGCTFLTIAEAICKMRANSGANPFEDEDEGKRLVQQNVMLFNAEKEFNREPGPDSDTRFDN